MNDKFTNNTNSDESIVRKLNQVADQTTINAQFALELEERLRIAHRPKMSWFASSFKQVSPTLRWVGLVILLGLVLNWSIKSLIPAPQPATDNTLTLEVTVDETGTPAPDSGGYDWRGTKLHLDAPLPKSPTEAYVYLLKPDQQVTVEEALALAQRFGIEGEVYQTPGRSPDTNGYLVSDGKQKLFINIGSDFDFYPDYSPNVFLSGSTNISPEEAYTAIDTFLKSHGFDFEYRIENAYQITGMYYVLPFTPDGLTIRHDYGIPARMEFVIDKNGQIAAVLSYRVDYDLVGTYSIRTAEEAFQQVLGSSNEIQNGVLESTRSGGGLDESIFWERSYPDNQTMTIYGQPISYPAILEGYPPLVSIDQYLVQGNIDGLDSLDDTLAVEAIGQFNIESGVRKFNVESWKVSDATSYVTPGSLRRKDDGQIVLYVGGGKEYSIPNAPEDIPLNTIVSDENPLLWVGGLMTGNDFFWKTIQYFPNGVLSQGGGEGGGGTGLYKLNLSGTPVPFPTPQPETNQGTVEYIVKEGDTVFAIAEAYGISPEKIVEANSWLSEEHALMPGKTLIIPGAQSNLGSSEYIVQENDTLSSIALNFGITVDELMKVNGLSDTMVFTGQKLIIPRGQVTSGQGIILPEEQLTQLEIGQQLEGTRGIFQVNIYEKSQRIWYGFFNINGEDSIYYILEGTDLQNLEAYNNLPVDIWGTVDHFDQYGKPIVKVDRYEIPFPDLKFQIFEGTQKLTEIQGQPVILFTTNDGETYIELTTSGTRFEQSGIFGKEGDEILIEALAIPDETFGDYPGLRMFSMNYAIDPISGQANELTITADQFNTYEEPPISTEAYIPPSATIEKVELVYYIPDPRSTPPDPNAGPPYIQPAWRFYGHYSNGDEFEILVQALKEEYLLPELAPYTPPG